MPRVRPQKLRQAAHQRLDVVVAGHVHAVLAVQLRRHLAAAQVHGDLLFDELGLSAEQDRLDREGGKIPEEWLAQIVAGYFAYHAVPTNSRAIAAFRYHVTILWYRQLRRRSQRVRLVWERMAELADAFLPKPRVLHPWPSVRFTVRHPR